MKFFRSIRWRLQLWHGLLLALVLAGFGFTAWRLQRTNQLRRLDQDLEQRVSAIAGAMRRSGGGNPGRLQPDRPDRPDRPLQNRPPGFGSPPPPPELRFSDRELSFFEGPSGAAFYYVVWLPGGRELARSESAPAGVPRPEWVDEPRDMRLRGTLRECIHFLPPGECILVGRNIREELADSRRFAWLLASAGGLVLVLGLAGGWWVSTRAIRPIADISATAARISTGNLTQRIHTTDADSELGDLARVLNDTFARLQAGFDRQAQFTADASHELRTPVAVVLTQTQTALARERPAAEYRESLAACQRAAQRMRRLIDSMLLLARLDSGEAAATRSTCALDRVAGEAVELLRPLAQQQSVTLDAELSPTRCLANVEQLGQVVTNLVSNAIYYNRPGGRVVVRVAATPAASLLSVSDTGQGIAPEDLPHLFERFYRADKARSSASGRTGLGLAITKAIVENHGGTVEVSSQLGQGSTFTVRWPETQG